ncbi:MAG: hypothetical protein E7639_06520 [Ruminococcaceae bacterium]|nr:hypothetical protein [Oscillospiraceae bacterium]
MSSKKSWGLFFALFLCFSLLAPSLANIFAVFAPTVALTDPDETVIIIDAGHGGIDGGATGKSGVLEKDLNLAIAAQLAAFCRLLGATVIETRTADISLASPDAKKGHVKQSDLENRVAIAQKYENAIFVSIHMNTFPQEKYHGLQVWYSQNDQSSKPLADTLQNNVRTHLQQDNHRKTKSATSSIYILRHLHCPAVLIECGFLSNPLECAALENEQAQKKLALVLAGALMEFKKIQSGTCAIP